MSDERDWKAVAQSLAADNARLCAIALVADGLAEAARKAVGDYENKHTAGLELALDAFKVVRQGT